MDIGLISGISKVLECVLHIGVVDRHLIGCFQHVVLLLLSSWVHVFRWAEHRHAHLVLQLQIPIYQKIGKTYWSVWTWLQLVYGGGPSFRLTNNFILWSLAMGCQLSALGACVYSTLHLSIVGLDCRLDPLRWWSTVPCHDQRCVLLVILLLSSSGGERCSGCLVRTRNLIRSSSRRLHNFHACGRWMNNHLPSDWLMRNQFPLMVRCEIDYLVLGCVEVGLDWDVCLLLDFLNRYGGTQTHVISH